jgi:DNA-binding response OmpR family regulator
MKILLIADDARLAGVVRSWMGLIGASMDWAVVGSEGEAALRSGEYNCVVLELGAQNGGGEGEAMLRRLRASGIDLPVLIITEGYEVDDRIRLFDLGADDLLVKPVHVGELSARLRALLRRCRRQVGQAAELLHGDLRVVPASRTVSRNGSFVPLTNKEFWVLETLLRSKGRVLTRQCLEEALHGRDGEIASNPLEVHIHHLRRKLGSELIRTVRGVGYTLGAES